MLRDLADRFSAPGAKRMLALDGGGTRGIISIAFLKQIEATLQRKLRRGDDFVLADYFDMIGGTSVGSILATMLALGWRVQKVEQTFTSWAPQVFRRLASFNDRYDAAALSKKISEVVHRETLSSGKLKTGLCIVAKRADTNSPWIMTNNPCARYFAGDGNTIANGDYLLHDVIRASTAAPTLFSPKEIEINAWHQGGIRYAEKGYFMDGALSPHNNPSFQMFLLAGLRGHNLGGAPVEALKEDRANGKTWQLGPDNLLMISVGTGSYSSPVRRSFLRVYEAVGALRSMIHDGEQLSVAQMQAMSNPRLSWTIDSEVGDLAADQLYSAPQLSYQRYDMPLELEWLSGNSGNAVQPGPELTAAIKRLRLNVGRHLLKLRKLIHVGAMGTLSEMASGAAADQVRTEDFPDSFDTLHKSSPSLG